MTGFEEACAAIDKLTSTALRIKSDRDLLYQACLEAVDVLDNLYDVDEPSPGKRKEYPFAGAGELLGKLRAALVKAGRK